MTGEVLGDNKEFAIVNVSDGDVTIYVYNTSGYTSANDTATAKYMNTSRPRIALSIRTDNVVQIVQIGNVVFTDPITVPANGSYTESWYEQLRTINTFDKIVIRPTQDNTNVKIRVKG